jgi:two-component system, NarL family, sensor histidine kinase UhpB
MLAARIAEAERLYATAALDLHDGPVQKLVWARHALRRLPAPAPAVDELHAVMSETLADLQDVIDQLNASSPEHEPLEGLLRLEAARCRRRHGTAVWLDLPDRLLPRPDDAVARNAYRIVQEALSNAARHGRPSRIRVRARIRSGRLLLCVLDDGRGFDPARVRRLGGGLGLRGMQQRAALLGGRVTVRTRIGGPTAVRALLPVRSDAA